MHAGKITATIGSVPAAGTRASDADEGKPASHQDGLRGGCAAILSGCGTGTRIDLTVPRDACAGSIRPLFRNIAQKGPSDEVTILSLDRRLLQGDVELDSGDFNDVSIRQ
jgi:hypothetical protein